MYSALPNSFQLVGWNTLALQTGIIHCMHSVLQNHYMYRSHKARQIESFWIWGNIFLNTEFNHLSVKLQ